MRSNPFATRYVRPGQLAWVACPASQVPASQVPASQPPESEYSANGVSAGKHADEHAAAFDDSPIALAERFQQAMGTQAAIVGPHGAGKSTLLECLKPLLPAPQISLRLRRSERPFRSVWHTTQHWTPGGILILDGFEQLSTMQAIRVCWMVRRQRMGLLVTCHRRTRLLPTLVTIRPTAQLVQRLVIQRLAEDSQLSQADRQRWTDLSLLQQWLTQEQGSVREVFMRLYDCYEDSRATQTG